MADKGNAVDNTEQCDQPCEKPTRYTKLRLYRIFERAIVSHKSYRAESCTGILFTRFADDHDHVRKQLKRGRAGFTTRCGRYRWRRARFLTVRSNQQYLPSPTISVVQRQLETYLDKSMEKHQVFFIQITDVKQCLDYVLYLYSCT